MHFHACRKRHEALNWTSHADCGRRKKFFNIQDRAPEARKSLAHPEASECEAGRVGRRKERIELRRGGTLFFTSGQQVLRSAIRLDIETWVLSEVRLDGKQASRRQIRLRSGRFAGLFLSLFSFRIRWVATTLLAVESCREKPSLVALLSLAHS